MKKVVTLIIILLVGIGFMTVTCFKYPKEDVKVSIVYYEGNYIENYAQDNGFTLRALSDTEYESLSEKYSLFIEEFSYDETDEGLEITGYDGLSEELIIPEYIDYKKVVSINFKMLSSQVKTIIIPSTVNYIEESTVSNVQIRCYQNTYCTELESSTSLNISFLNDSDSINFNAITNDIEYNIYENEIEITSIKGTGLLVIPQTINGKAVTSLSLNIPNEDGIEIFIPYTVTNIQSLIELTKNDILTLSLILELIVLIIFIATVILLLQNKYIYISSLFVIGIVYFLLMNILIYLAVSNLVLKFIIITIIYLVIFIMVFAMRNRLDNYDKTVKNSKTFVYEALDLASDYKDKDLIELIKYSDPVSNENTKPLEDEIIQKLGDNTSSLEEIKKLIKKRNEVCKRTK